MNRNFLATALLAIGLASSTLGQTLSQKVLAGRAIHKEYQRLKSVTTSGNPMLLLPSFAKKRSEFIPETCGQVLGVFYAKFKDGRGFVYFDNFPRLPWESAPQPDQEAQLVPFGNRAMILTANTPDFAAYAATATSLTSMFTQAGYVAVKGTLTIEQLLTSQGSNTASAMVLHSYGGYAPVTLGNYAIYTSSIVSSAGETTHAARLTGDEMVYAMADDGSDPATAPLRYGISSNFVSRSMGFKPGGVVFLNCGPVGQSSGASMRASFLVSGADLILSFNGRSGPEAYPNIEYLFDRWLGANQVERVTPPQRPFSYAAVETRMRDLGRFKDPKTLAPIIATRSSGTSIQLLRPTIHWMEVLPNNELWIRGQFGSKRSDSKVTVGGVSKTIVSWADTLIKVRLTDALTGNNGSVVVWHGTLKSNPRPLVQWRGTVRTELNLHAGNLTYPAQRQIIDYTLVLRGDPYRKRDKVDQEPLWTKARFSATNASKADYAVTGYVNDDGKWVRVWFGSGTFLHTLDPNGAATNGSFSGTGTFTVLGEHKLSLFTNNDLVARFIFQGTEQWSNLGLHHISLFDYLTPLAYAMGWKNGVLNFTNIDAKIKPKWEIQDAFHEVRWSAFTGSPGYLATTTL